MKQAKTARWILGWSHTGTRLPDVSLSIHQNLKCRYRDGRTCETKTDECQVLTRPHNLIPGTSFARLLPPPNTWVHIPKDPIPLSQLSQTIREVLGGISLLPPSGKSEADIEDATELMLEPRRNTWSRAARRQAARGEGEGVPDANGLVDPLFRARLTVSPGEVETPPSDLKSLEELEGEPSSQQQAGASTEALLSDGKNRGEMGSKVTLDWLEGRDRTIVDALWKFLLNKAGLMGKRDREDDGVQHGGRERPEGHWRGGGGGFRGKWSRGGRGGGGGDRGWADTRGGRGRGRPALE